MLANKSRGKTAGLIAVLILLCFPVLAEAQSNSDQEDVVYLKNGSILRGEIIERIDDKIIKIQTVGRNVLVISINEVEKIDREKIARTTYYKTTGYFNHSGIDVLPGEDATTLRYQMVNGYQFSPKFSAGLGIGFVPYDDPLDLVPVFLDGRYRFREMNTTPFIFVRIGYSISSLSDEDTQLEVESHRGGLILNPGVGVELYTSDEFGWYLTAGLNIDKSRFEQVRWDGRILETDINYRRVQFGIGLIF
jgi:hypothetical protein